MLGYQRPQSEESEEKFLLDWAGSGNNYLENFENTSTTSSVCVCVGSDIEDDDVGSVQSENENEITAEDISSGNVEKQRRQLQKYIKMNRDIVKFISKRRKYSQELSEELETLCAEMQLIPQKSLIKVTKKLGSKCVKDWNKRCTSAVLTFCSRFGKVCLELKKSTRVRNDLPKLGGMLRWSSAAYWIENKSTKLAVMTEQSERRKVLEQVKEFLQISESNGKEDLMIMINEGDDYDYERGGVFMISSFYNTDNCMQV